MANNDQNDKELNDYLNGDSELSKAYRASNKVEPSSHLDEKILSAAKESVENTNQEEKNRFHKSPWVKPVSIAALVTLSVSLVVTMQQETGQPLISEPGVEMYDSTTFIEDKEIVEESLSSNEAVVESKAELRQDEVERVKVAPEALGAASDFYREEEIIESPKVRMKEAPAKRMLLKEKSQLQTEILEQRVLADEQATESVQKEVEFDDDVKTVEDHQFTLDKNISKKLEVNTEFRSCENNTECMQIIDTCDRCTCGSPINKKHLDDYLLQLSKVCESYEGLTCKYKCPKIELSCIEGECKVSSEN